MAGRAFVGVSEFGAIPSFSWPLSPGLVLPSGCACEGRRLSEGLGGDGLAGIALPSWDLLPDAEDRCRIALLALRREWSLRETVDGVEGLRFWFAPRLTPELFAELRGLWAQLGWWQWFGALEWDGASGGVVENPAQFATESARLHSRVIPFRSCADAWKWDTRAVLDSARPRLLLDSASVVDALHATEGVRSTPRFPPPLAWAVFDHFGARRVLDPFVGWGDRLAVALAHPGVEAFWGLNDNPHSQPGCERLLQALPDKPHFRVDMLCASALHARNAQHARDAQRHSDDGAFDLVFTSVPRWGVDVYDECSDTEESQNLFQFRDSLGSWIQEFWRPALAGCVSRLAEGGRVVLDLGCFEAPGKSEAQWEWARAVRRETSACAGLVDRGVLAVRDASALRDAVGAWRSLWVWEKECVRHV